MNPSDLQVYIAGARRRQQQKQMRLGDRYALLQAASQQGAALLKKILLSRGFGYIETTPLAQLVTWKDKPVAPSLDG
jgi:hypothetical protein